MSFIEKPATETQASLGGTAHRNPSPAIEVKGLEMAYGSYVLARDIDFTVATGEIMVIMGGSGCGKSTLLKYLIGLKEVEKGEILYGGQSFSRRLRRNKKRCKEDLAFCTRAAPCGAR